MPSTQKVRYTKNMKQKKIIPQQLKLKTGKALVIVAHPDDETIWMSGTIMKNPQINWTILSLCRASDADRAPKFKKVCHFLKAKPLITDLDDENKISLKRILQEITKIIIKQIDKREFDYIFTHGANGEYGHPRHIATHIAVKQLIKQGRLSCQFAFFFNYCKINKKEFSPLRIKKDTQYILSLSKAELQKKKNIMSKIYGFDPQGIDTNYCTQQEGFKKIKGNL